jgi:hypothetical protein
MWKAQPITEETGWVEIMDGDTYIGATRGPNSERNAQIMAAGEDMVSALHVAFYVLQDVTGDAAMICRERIQKALEKAGEM